MGRFGNGDNTVAEKGHARAAALAGEMHLPGKGTPVSGSKTVKFFELGAGVSDPDATALLGMALAAGMAGVKVDFIKAQSPSFFKAFARFRVALWMRGIRQPWRASIR